MSTISNVHQIVVYDSKKSAPYSGQRLAKVIFKGRGDKKAEYESQCASVPQVSELDVQAALPQFMPHLVRMVEDAQDRIVREVFLAGRDTVKDEELSVESVLALLEREAAGTRVTKERIGCWYDASLAAELSAAFAAKLGSPQKAAIAVAQCKELFVSAAGRGTLPTERRKQLEKFYGYANIEADPEISAWMWDRITAQPAQEGDGENLLAML